MGPDLQNSTPAAAPVLDLDALQERLGGDDGLMAELAQMLAEDARRLAAECTAAAEAGDHVKARQAAHTLKGAAGNLCATRVVSSAAHLERLARQSPGVVNLEAAAGEVRREVERLLPELEALASGPSAYRPSAG